MQGQAASASSCDAQWPLLLGAMLAPAQMSVLRPPCTAVARLAVAAPLPSVIRAIGISQTVISLGRRALIMVRIIRCSTVARALDMSDTRFFLPVIRLVGVCVDVGDDGGGGASGGVRAIDGITFAGVG